MQILNYMRTRFGRKLTPGKIRNIKKITLILDNMVEDSEHNLLVAET